jgi:hypothetical protein
MQVRVKRAGLRVRARSGFFGTSDREFQPVPRTKAAQIQHAMASPIGASALSLRLTTLFSSDLKNGSYLNSMLFFDPKQLTFTDEPDDVHNAVFDIVAVTFGDNGQQVDGTDKTWTMRLKGDRYREVLKNGLVYSVHLPVKKPGAYQVRVVLRDAGSELLGSASQFIQIPDVGKGRLALSGIVLHGDQSQPTSPAGADPAAEGHQAASDPQASSAVRIFKPGTNVAYAYQILNAQAGANQKTDLEVQTRLFRYGAEVYQGKPKPMQILDQPDPRHMIGGGQLALGGKIAPGDYVFQVIVTDKLAKEKYRVATQAMDFEIQAALPPQP